MALVPSRFRPYVALLLGLMVTGLGHLYLRKWRRLALWVTLAFAVSIVFVPESAARALLDGQPVDLVNILPSLLISATSAFDAFRTARQRVQSEQRAAMTESANPAAGTAETASGPETETVDCPACGRPVDPELGFCHWCTTEFEPRTE